MKSHEKFVIVDVREEDEYEMAHADGAILFPYGEIDGDSAAELLPDPYVPLLIYCRTGRRSAIAAKTLEELGYTEIYDLGGLNGWPYGISYGQY